MLSKQRILSELVATRNIIKSKYNRAYADRMKRERVMKEVLKPVTSAITTLKPAKEFEKPPPPGTKRRKMPRKNQGKKQNESTDDSNDDDTLLLSSSSLATHHSTSPNKKSENESQRTLLHSPSRIRNKISMISSTPKRAESSTSMAFSTPMLKDDVNTDKFTYEVEYDDDPIIAYDLEPDHNLTVHATKTSKATGHMTPVTMKWRELPRQAKTQWLRDRKQINKFVNTPMTQEESDRQMPAILSKSRLKSKRLLSYDTDEKEAAGAASLAYQKSEKKRGKGMDFNFIPYNINNRIIYEYFDDPNELCERLRLLVSSRKAGNTNHMQEINSIIEELRELQYII